MAEEPKTVASTPNPQITVLVMALLRALIIIAGAVGLTIGTYTDAQLAPLAGAISLIVGLSWTAYEQFRQARIRHATAVASARGGKAVQKRDFVGDNT